MFDRLTSFLSVILVMNLRHLRKATMLIPQLRRPATVNRKPPPLLMISEFTAKSRSTPGRKPRRPLRADFQLVVVYGIGHVINRAGRAETQRRRRFQCFLVARAQFAVGLAVPQLLAYLACLHQSRLERNRTDASVAFLPIDTNSSS
jgi:hypothetical protein